MNLHVKYILVGGGVASGAAAAAIRKIDPQGDLLLIGQEINRPYHRPPLSKQFLRGRFDRQSLFAQPADWFERNHVQLRTGRRVSHLDTTRTCVTLDNGETISFDRLLIATGGHWAHLSIPGSHLPNLFYLRTLEEAERLQHAIEKALAEGRRQDGNSKKRGRAVVIGAGTLGLELAASLTTAGLQVDLSAAGAYPWERLIGEPTGRAIARFAEKRGVRFHAGAPAIRLEGDGRVQRVVLADGLSLDCDFAVAAVGMHVNKDILRSTSLAAERAILVDSQCRTNIPDIFAAGDCAAVFDPLFGKHRNMDHSNSAEITGQIAGTNMAGGSASFDSVSEFTSEVFDLTIRVWGEGRFVDRRIMREIPGSELPDIIEFGVAADGRIAQVVAVGHAGDADIFNRIVQSRLAINGNQERLKDPTIPLEKAI